MLKYDKIVTFLGTIQQQKMHKIKGIGASRKPNSDSIT